MPGPWEEFKKQDGPWSEYGATPAAPPEKPKATGVFRKAGDVGLSIAKGVIGVPETAVGLADLVSGGAAGKAVEGLGVRFKDAKQVLTDLQSDDLKGKQQQFQRADGVVDKLGVALSNPSLIANTVAESLPVMGAGGVAARGVLGLGARGVSSAAGGVGPAVPGLLARTVGAEAAPVVAGAIGEGVAGAGSAAEQIRQETPTGDLTGTQSALAAGSGLATGLIGVAGGALARRMGIADPDAMIAAGTRNVVAPATARGAIRRTAEGAVAESLFEEVPQSLSEQAFQNAALGRPLTEGMADAGVMGGLAGATMGGVAGALARPAVAPAPTAPPAVPPGLTTSPGAGGPSGTQPMPPNVPTEFSTSPGASGGQQGIDYSRDIDTSGLALAGMPRPSLTGTNPEDLMLRPAADPLAGGPRVGPLTAAALALPAPAARTPGDALAPSGATPGAGAVRGVGPLSGAAAFVPPQQPAIEGPRALAGPDTITDNGQPFRSGVLAQRAARQAGLGFRPVAVEGGWVVRRDNSQAEDAQIKEPTNAAQPRLQAPAATAATPDAQPAGDRPGPGPVPEVRGPAGGQTVQPARPVDANTPPTPADSSPAPASQAQPDAPGSVRPGRADAVQPSAAPAAAVAPAPSAAPAPATKGLRIGITPNDAEPVTVRGNVVYLGQYPLQNFDTGEDVTVPEGANELQIRKAIADSGALTKKQKFFGKEVAPAPAAQQNPTAPNTPLKAPSEQSPSASTTEGKADTPGRQGKPAEAAPKIAATAPATSTPSSSPELQAYMAASAEVLRLETELIGLRSDTRIKPSGREDWWRKIGALERELQSAKALREQTGATLRSAPAPAATAAPATHQDPGQAPEPATPAVIAESLKTAAREEDRKPSAMKAELLARIDEAITEAPDYTEYQGIVKSMGLKDANAMYTRDGSSFGEKFAPKGYSRPTRTFDVEGDGKFTVNNTVRQLLTFREKVDRSPGFRDAKTPPPATPRATDTLDRRGTDAAIANMIDERDFEAAKDFAAYKGVDVDEVKLTKVLRDRWDKWKKTGESAAKIAAWEAEQAAKKEAAPAAADRVRQMDKVDADMRMEAQWQKLMSGQPVDLTREEAAAHLERLNAAPGDNPKARKVLEAAVQPEKAIAGQTFDDWVQAEYEGNEYRAKYLEEFAGDEKRAMLGAVLGIIDNDRKSSELLKDARSKYLGTLLGLPREASIDLKVWDALDNMGKVEAQRHFYDLDGRISKRTQEETRARVQAEKEKKAPYEAAFAEVDAEIRRLDKLPGPETQKQKELSARRDRLREALFQIGQGKEPDGRLLRAEPALDMKGFLRTPRGNGAFDLTDGKLRVEVNPTDMGKFQARIGSAKSSPSLDEQTVVDWAANYRENAQRAAPSPVAESQAPAIPPVSSREGQMRLANRGSRIAALKLMNEQLRKIAPAEAWADSNIEDATDLDALQDQISGALVAAQSGPAAVNPLRAELEAMSGAELRGIMERLNLAGTRMTQDERVEALLAEDEAEVRAAMQAPDQAAKAAAAATRTRPRDTITFPNPVTGPSGQQLVAYTWQWKPMEMVDKRGEDRTVRISNWQEAATNPETGRDVVHQFTVRAPGGDEQTVSAESAMKLLGYVDAGTAKAPTSVMSAAKTLAKWRMAQAETKALLDRFDQDDAEVKALALPAMPTEKDEKGWWNMGDASVRQIEAGPLTEERKRALIGAWRDNRMQERGWKTSGDMLAGKAREIEDALKRAERKLKEATSAAAAAAPAPAEKPATKIEDFGQKLEGARKDYAATLKDAEAVDIAAEPLSKSWPEPDYDKLLAGGADPYVVAFVHAARDEVPTKPQKGWKLKGWVQSVETLRGASKKLLAGEISKDRVQTLLNDDAFGAVRRAVGSRAELYELVGHAKSLKGVTFAQHHYSLYKGQNNVTKWVVEQKVKSTAFSNWPRELAVADTKAEMLEQFKAKFSAESLDGDKAKAATKGQFIIYRKRNQEGAFIGKKIGREYIDLKKLPDVAAARAYLESNTADLSAALERYKDTPFERNAENRPRVGDDHRNGAAVTPEVFADTFGFRGVQFGNYVEQDRRQSDLNQTFDALMDMAAVLGVPPRALSLNGRLGLAFGARGKGGKNAPAAHYEPDTVVINLTKGNGPGSLGHEWWHAVDNYFGKEFGEGGFATDGARVDRLRAEMQAAFKAVRNATQVPTLRKRAAELDKRRTKPYWNTPLELSARAFESYLIAKLNDQGAANDYLANVVDEKVWNLSEEARATFFGGEAVETYPYPGQAELPAVRAGFDEFFKVVETREDDAGNVAMFSRGTQLRRGDPTTGLTTTAFTQAMEKAFGPSVARRLEESGVVVPLADQNSLPAHIQKFVRADDVIFGFYDPKTDRTYAVLSNLRPEMVKGLVIHEVGVHYGFEGMLGKPKYNEVIGRIKMLGRAGNKEVLAARKSAEDGSAKPSQIPEETLAYLVMNHPDMSLIRDVIAKIKAFLFDKFGIGGDYLSVDDITQLAKAAVKHASRTQPGERRPDFVQPADFMRVFHGTPHQVDKFSTAKIGTGEGAQAYGWGLYFADSKEVADHYRRTLSPVAVDGTEVRSTSLFQPPRQNAGYAIGSRMAQDMSFEKAKDAARREAKAELAQLRQSESDLRARDKSDPGKDWGAFADQQADRAATTQRMVDAIEIMTPKDIKAGNIYEVEIPDDGEYLLWDKPLSEQPEGVSKALTSDTATMAALEEDQFGGPVMDQVTGRDFYRKLSTRLAAPLREIDNGGPRGWGGYTQTLNDKAANDEAASKALRAAGVRGIKYLDGASRTKSLRDVKREFLAELPEDADFNEVTDLIGSGTFSPQNEAILKELAANDWLGFDYPAQAISAALGGKLADFDASPALVKAVADAQEDGTFNYVIFDDADVEIAQAMFSRQGDQTETPAFRAWFKDSKVVDAEGNPLVVYHGTRSDVAAFADDKVKGRFPNSEGFYFTSRPQHASVYADSIQNASEDFNPASRFAIPVAEGANVMPAYVSLQNPKVLTVSAWGTLESRVDGDGGAQVRAAREAGHDGVIVKREAGDEWDGMLVIAFRPEQIKSAIGNRGTFDPGNPDIMFSRSTIAGATTRQYSPEQQRAMRNVGFEVDQPTYMERAQALWKDAGKKLAQGIADQFAPIKDLDAKAYSLLRLSKGASGAFETFLHGGKLKLSDGVYDFDEAARGGVLDSLLIPLQGEHHDFFRWVAANRAERLAREGRENLFTPQDIADLKTLADGQLAFDFTLTNGMRAGQTTRSRAEAYRDSLATFNAFNKNVLDLAEQSGLIDGESRHLWEHEFYVPFYRVAEDADGGIRGANIKTGVIRQEAFKKLKGGGQALNMDLLDNTLLNWAHLLDAAAKNRGAKATLEAAQRMGVAVEAPERVAREIGNATGNKQGVVWFMDEGLKRYFVVDDRYILEALTSLEYAGMRNPVMDAMGAFKHALTVGVTASPFFKVRNLIRDSVQVIGTSGIGVNPAANVAQGWKLTDPKSDAYFRLLAGGGTIHFGTMMEGNEAKRVQALVESGVDSATILNSQNKVKAFYRKYIEPGITAYNELGNRGEAVNRAALYQQLRAQGKDHAEASLQARDLMDFSMQGTFTTIRFLTQVVPFFNARIQGMYKLGRAAKEDPARFSAVIGATALFSIALLVAYGDDDDWKKREEWDRNGYWWFKFGGTAFRIPKPFEIGAMATLAERSWELAFDEEMTGTRFRKQVQTLLADNLSMNPIPQLIKPVVDVYANKDSFTGRPIETMDMERLRADYRFTDRTSMFARGVSTAMNSVTGMIGAEALSPVQVDHMLRGYFGWLGAFIVGAGDTIARPATDQPSHPTPDYWKTVTGGMASDLRDAPSRYVSQMYEQAKEIEKAYGTWKMLLREGKIDEAREFREDNAELLNQHKQVERVKKAESALNQRARMIERSNMDPDRKRELLRQINEQKDRTARLAS